MSLFDARTFLSIAPDATGCCQVLFAGGAPYANDRVGPFHGGYQESIKTKGIQPKYVTKSFIQDANEAQQAILHIGTTQWTETGGTGETAGCCPEFPLW